jgi:hypothetical protein
MKILFLSLYMHEWRTLLVSFSMDIISFAWIRIQAKIKWRSKWTKSSLNLFESSLLHRQKRGIIFKKCLLLQKRASLLISKLIFALKNALECSYYVKLLITSLLILLLSVVCFPNSLFYRLCPKRLVIWSEDKKEISIRVFKTWDDLLGIDHLVLRNLCFHIIRTRGNVIQHHLVLVIKANLTLHLEKRESVLWTLFSSLSIFLCPMIY